LAFGISEKKVSAVRRIRIGPAVLFSLVLLAGVVPGRTDGPLHDRSFPRSLLGGGSVRESGTDPDSEKISSLHPAPAAPAWSKQAAASRRLKNQQEEAYEIK